MRKSMPAVSLTIIVLSLMVFLLSSCSGSSGTEQHKTAENSAFQELYNRSIVAKEYADERIDELLQSLYPDYTVKETACGFVTAENPYYVVRYKCSDGVQDLFYGYRIAVDNSGSRTIIEEGADTGSTLLE